MSSGNTEAPGYRAPLAKLPAAYRTALLLRDDGASDEQLATELGIDVAAVPGLMTIARAKLQRYWTAAPT